MASYLDKTGLAYLWGKITSALADKVSSVQTTATSDLDIADENDNVLVRFSYGHIQTKNFNSRNVYSKTDVDTAISTKVSSTEITSIVSMTQAAYDALATKDANTLYIIPES